MKRLIIIYILLLLYVKGYSQNTLSGKVIDKETNLPLVGAAVYLPDLKKGVSTDVQGNFILRSLPTGSFLIEVKYLGYGSYITRVAIKGEAVLDVQLSEIATEVNEVVITGVSTSTERKLNPIPSLTMNKDMLNQQQSTNIIDAIAKQPGVSQISTGAGISKPVIRGLGYNRIVTLNNGIKQEGQQWGDEHGIEIDEYAVERVEIIKGPGSLIYGSDALGGVINFLYPDPVQEGEITGGIMSNYQTNNNLLGWSGYNAGNLKGYNWMGRASSKNAGNYSNKYDGKVYNSGYDEFNFNGQIGVNKSWGYSHLNFSSFNQTVGLVEGERDSTGRFLKLVAVNDSTVEEETVSNADLTKHNIDIPRQSINHIAVSSMNNIYVGRSRVTLNLAYQQNKRKEFGDVLAADAPELYFILNTINYDLKYFLPELRGWENALGFSGMYQSSENKGGEFIIPAYSLFDAGVFLFSKKNFKKLNLSGGVRFDQRKLYSEELLLNEDGEETNEDDTAHIHKFEGFETDFNNVSGSIGASYRITKNVIGKLNFARGFRAPNIAELASNGIHEGTFRYEIGNRNLKSETSLQTDAGILINTDHASIEIEAFSNNIQNYIFSEKLNSISGGDSIVNTDEPNPAFKFVQGDALLYGGEISTDIHPHPLDWLHFENSFSIVRAIQKNQPDSMKYLPFIPAPKFRSEIRTDFKKAGKILKNIYANIQFEYFFEQNQFYSAFGTETTTPGYSLFNAGMGTDIVNKKGNTLFSMYFNASNLFDVTYQSHLSRLKYAPENLATGRVGVYNMGRNFSVRLVVPLTFKKAL